MITRRAFIAATLTASALVAGKAYAMGIFSKKEAAKSFPFTLSDAEWKARLTPEQYRVLRGHGTERAGTSPLNDEKRAGTYHCAGCDHPLFDAADKYDSRSGWPSFFQPLNEQAVGKGVDHKLGYPRVEIHCANCGGHLGHVFEDGPQPTGLRYCMNGVSLSFKPSV
jgi:peptide-methionine (R)-S-oxide reductase